MQVKAILVHAAVFRQCLDLISSYDGTVLLYLQLKSGREYVMIKTVKRMAGRLFPRKTRTADKHGGA